MSEAELDKALGYITMVWDESSVFGQPPDYSHIHLTGKQEAKEAIQALIRTEKLKLLAEVRERVQVNQKGQFEQDGTGTVCWYLDDLVETLKELGAEL